MVKQKTEQKKQGELIYGINPIVELLRAKRRKLLSLYTTKPLPKGFAVLEKLMPKYQLPIQYVSRDVLARMAGTTDHQGVVAWASPFPFRSKIFKQENHPFLVMIDGVQDPRNLGAVIRSAYCAGAHGIIMSKKNSAPLTAVALKASAGLAEHCDIYVAPSAQVAAQELAQKGYTLYVTAFDGINAQECVYKAPLCVVIGSEGEGVSKAVLPMGTKITIPQREVSISYNASVAAGIIFFIIGTQKKYI